MEWGWWSGTATAGKIDHPRLKDQPEPQEESQSLVHLRSCKQCSMIGENWGDIRQTRATLEGTVYLSTVPGSHMVDAF